MNHAVFLFGEAEKGELCTPYLVKTQAQLFDVFGNPPNQSQGLSYAVQTLLFKRDLLYFRVQEEGFSTHQYMLGLKLLQNKEIPLKLLALCLPGVGSSEIIEATIPICHLYKTILIISEKDLYDYLSA